jgi:hypothetical protein
MCCQLVVEFGFDETQIVEHFSSSSKLITWTISNFANLNILATCVQSLLKGKRSVKPSHNITPKVTFMIENLSCICHDGSCLCYSIPFP